MEKNTSNNGSWTPCGLEEEKLSFNGKPIPECVGMVCDALKKELVTVSEDLGKRLLSPKHIFSKIDDVEYIKARIDRRLSAITHNGIREDYLMWLAEDIILLMVSIKMKQEKAP